MVLNKGIFETDIYKVRVVFTRIHTARLEVNTNKFSSGLKYIPYLGNKIYRNGIKTDPSKVQGIKDLNIPTITT